MPFNNTLVPKRNPSHRTGNTAMDATGATSHVGLKEPEYIAFNPPNMNYPGARVLTFLWSLAMGLFVQGQWTQLDLNTGAMMHSVHYRPDGNIWIGALDTIHYSLDHGDSFDKRPTRNTDLGNIQILGVYSTIHAFNPTDAILSGVMWTGAAESIFRTEDAGMGYTEVYNAQPAVYHAINDMDLSQAPLGIAVGTNGRILRTTDGGISWAAVPSGTTESIATVCSTGANSYLTSGFDGTRRSVDGGMTWSLVSGALDLRQLVASGTVCYGLAGSGSIWKSMDGGLNWSLVGEVPGSGLEIMEIADVNTVFVAGISALYRSTTGGAYWERFDLPGYEEINQIDFTDANHGVAVGWNGYAIRTTNGGGPALPICSISPPGGAYCSGVMSEWSVASDPAYQYEWLVDGVTAGTDIAVDLSFEPGEHLIQLIADNGTGRDTASSSIIVQPSPEVVPYSPFAELDTLCPNNPTSILVPLSQIGVSYRLWNGNTPVGASQTGNNGTRTFPTGALSATTIFQIRAYQTNSCGSDSLHVPIAVTVFDGSPASSFELARDTLCAPGSTSLIVHGTVPGYGYYWQTSSGLPQQSPVLAAGGDLILPIPTISNDNTSQFIFTVRVRYGNLNCPQPINGRTNRTDRAERIVQILPPKR